MNASPASSLSVITKGSPSKDIVAIKYILYSGLSPIFIPPYFFVLLFVLFFLIFSK